MLQTGGEQTLGQAVAPEIHVDELSLLTEQISRLKFDRAIEPSVNFNPITGEAISDPLTIARLKADVMKSSAIWNISQATGEDPSKMNFSPYSGEPIDPENNDAKLKVLREGISARLKNIKSKGAILPNFDPISGAKLPDDCLVRLELADPKYLRTTEDAQMQNDVNLGLSTLQRMKEIRAQYSKT